MAGSFHGPIYAPQGVKGNKHWCIRFIKWCQKEQRTKLRIHNGSNGSWHETLNSLHVTRGEILHFVTSYMNQNKKRKQILESAQYGLENPLKVIFGGDDERQYR